MVRPTSRTTAGQSSSPIDERRAGQQQPHQDVDQQNGAAADAPAAQHGVFFALAADEQPGDQRDEIEHQPADGQTHDDQLLGEGADFDRRTSASRRSAPGRGGCRGAPRSRRACRRRCWLISAKRPRCAGSLPSNSRYQAVSSTGLSACANKVCRSAPLIRSDGVEEARREKPRRIMRVEGMPERRDFQLDGLSSRNGWRSACRRPARPSRRAWYRAAEPGSCRRSKAARRHSPATICISASAPSSEDSLSAPRLPAAPSSASSTSRRWHS